MGFDWYVLAKYYPMLLEGLYRTLTYTMIGLVTSVAFGLFVAMIQSLKIPILEKVIDAYIAVGRETPLLVQLFFIFHGLPVLTGVLLSAPQAGIAAITFNEGAFIAEIIRGGVQGVAKTQWDAAKAMAMSNFQCLRYVILPQGIRKVVPTLIGHSSYLLKDTALLSLIAIEELTSVAYYVNYMTLSSATVFTAVGVIYLVTFWLLNGIGIVFEKKMNVETN